MENQYIFNELSVICCLVVRETAQFAINCHNFQSSTASRFAIYSLLVFFSCFLPFFFIIRCVFVLITAEKIQWNCWCINGNLIIAQRVSKDTWIPLQQFDDGCHRQPPFEAVLVVVVVDIAKASNHLHAIISSNSNSKSNSNSNCISGNSKVTTATSTTLIRLDAIIFYSYVTYRVEFVVNLYTRHRPRQLYLHLFISQ